MKTHEFARHLELLAKLLRQLPDAEMEDAHLAALVTSSDNVNVALKDGGRSTRPLQEGIEKQLIGMTVAQVEAFLSSETEAFTVAHLSEIAERLGIASSKRQNKNALINMITRQIEAEQMHSILRGARTEDVGSAALPLKGEDGKAH